MAFQVNMINHCLLASGLKYADSQCVALQGVGFCNVNANRKLTWAMALLTPGPVHVVASCTNYLIEHIAIGRLAGLINACPL